MSADKQSKSAKTTTDIHPYFVRFWFPFAVVMICIVFLLISCWWLWQAIKSLIQLRFSIRIIDTKWEEKKLKSEIELRYWNADATESFIFRVDFCVSAQPQIKTESEVLIVFFTMVNASIQLLMATRSAKINQISNKFNEFRNKYISSCVSMCKKENLHKVIWEKSNLTW